MLPSALSREIQLPVKKPHHQRAYIGGQDVNKRYYEAWTYRHLYAVPDICQPLRGRLDGRRPGELGAGRLSHRTGLPQTRCPAPDPHLALRPRGADDVQVHRTTTRRPRGHAVAEPPPGVR